MPDVPRSSPKENLRASQSNTYLSPGSLFKSEAQEESHHFLRGRDFGETQVILHRREQNYASTSCGHHVDQAVDVPL